MSKPKSSPTRMRSVRTFEILERNEGYEGFNQTGISQIIRRTDPRVVTVGA